MFGCPSLWLSATDRSWSAISSECPKGEIHEERQIVRQGTVLSGGDGSVGYSACPRHQSEYMRGVSRNALRGNWSSRIEQRQRAIWSLRPRIELTAGGGFVHERESVRETAGRTRRLSRTIGRAWPARQKATTSRAVAGVSGREIESLREGGRLVAPCVAARGRSSVAAIEAKASRTIAVVFMIILREARMAAGRCCIK